MGGGNLANQSKKKGFAISGILYPLLILTLFLVVQMLFMLQTRKNVLDKSRMELAESVNASNKVYTNEELSTLVDELKSNQSKILSDYKNDHMNNKKDFFAYKSITTANCNNTYININNIYGPVLVEIKMFANYNNINYGGYVKYTLGAALGGKELYGLGTNIDKQGELSKAINSITSTYSDNTRLKLKLNCSSFTAERGSDVYFYVNVISTINLTNTTMILE